MCAMDALLDRAVQFTWSRFREASAGGILHLAEAVAINSWLLVQIDAAAGRHTTALFSCPSLSDAVGSLRGFVAPEISVL